MMNKEKRRFYVGNWWKNDKCDIYFCHNSHQNSHQERKA